MTVCFIYISLLCTYSRTLLSSVLISKYDEISVRNLSVTKYIFPAGFRLGGFYHKVSLATEKYPLRNKTGKRIHFVKVLTNIQVKQERPA